MRMREPLLYEQYIGQYLTDEEVQYRCKVVLSVCISLKFEFLVFILARVHAEFVLCLGNFFKEFL